VGLQLQFPVWGYVPMLVLLSDTVRVVADAHWIPVRIVMVIEDGVDEVVLVQLKPQLPEQVL
jgi:hypothetical protein